jgi:long-chain fatty acid transport protein
MKAIVRSTLPILFECQRFEQRLALWFMGMALLLSADARAVGLRLPNQDPEAIARGNAFAATADNPSAIYYNPAGITQLEGDQIRVGLYMISADTKYTSPSGVEAYTDKGFQVVPQLYYTHTFQNAPFSLGLGVYAPFGLGLDWGDNPPFGLIAQRGTLRYVTINPVIAWRLHDTLSLAIGPTINYSEADLENQSFNFKGNDVAFGFNAGLLWQPHEKWSIGLNYRSATDMNFEGDSDFPAFPGSSVPTEAAAHFPCFAVAGVSFRPTTNWNFEFNVDWTDWNSLDQIVFQRADAINIPLAFNYQSSWMYEFGVTRQLGKGWFISFGYIFSENSSPDANFNPMVPDDNLHLGSVGFGHHGQHWDWAVGYHFAYNGERTVTGANIPLANGTYQTFNNALNLSATFKF